MEPNHRRCISCRVVAPKSHFLRVVREHSTGKIELDRGMGRSAYLCWSIDCIRQAQKKKRLERALRSPLPSDLYAALEKKIQERPWGAESPVKGLRDVL
jgi:uncharacterized protein